MRDTVRSLATGLFGVAGIVVSAMFVVEAWEAPELHIGIMLVGLASAAASFSIELVADAATPGDETPAFFDRLGSVGMGVGLITVGLAFAYSVASSPPMGENATTSLLFSSALVIALVAVGLRISVIRRDDEDEEADEPDETRDEAAEGVAA